MSDAAGRAKRPAGKYMKLRKIKWPAWSQITEGSERQTWDFPTIKLAFIYAVAHDILDFF